MSVVRRFLVAPSLVRLIRKERGGSRISEGYFAPQGGRTSFVRIDGHHCHLVLVSSGPNGTSTEERTEVPRAHGDALLDVCSGKAIYDRTSVSLGGGREAMIDRYTVPAGLDLISVTFDDEATAEGFRPPLWFGAEVSVDEAYDRHAIALKGVPPASETALSNAALDAVLDLIEPRYGFGRNASITLSPRRDEPMAPWTAAPPPPAAPKQAEPAAPPTQQPATASAPEPEAAAKPAEEAPATSEAEPAAGEMPAAEAAPENEPAPTETAQKGSEPEKGDARIDDVIESLSQALGAAIQKPQEPAREDELAASFERWTVRPRRTQQ